MSNILEFNAQNKTFLENNFKEGAWVFHFEWDVLKRRVRYNTPPYFVKFFEANTHKVLYEGFWSMKKGFPNKYLSYYGSKSVYIGKVEKEVMNRYQAIIKEALERREIIRKIQNKEDDEYFQILSKKAGLI